MRVSGRRLSRLELGLIAAALLLPMPLVALNGYAAALPGAVERGLGSLVTLEAGDDRSGIEARGQARENGSYERRSADATLAITRAKVRSSANDETEPAESADGEAAPGSSDGADTTPQNEPSDEADDTGSSAPSGESDGASGDGEGGSSASSGDTPGLSLTIGGDGTAAGVSAGSSGVTVQLGADSEGAGSGDAAAATVEVTDTEGSSSGVGISAPGTGSVIP